MGVCELFPEVTKSGDPISASQVAGIASMSLGVCPLHRFLLKFKRLRVSSPSPGASPQGVIDMKVEK
jgi:hypothetical protein